MALSPDATTTEIAVTASRPQPGDPSTWRPLATRFLYAWLPGTPGPTTFTSVVVDAQSGVPVPGVEVRLNDATTQTGLDGSFSIPGARSGVMIMTKPGFVAGTVPVTKSVLASPEELSIVPLATPVVVGPAGATLRTPRGTELQIPAGAIDEPTPISLTDLVGSRSNTGAAGLGLVDISPAFTFELPATLRYEFIPSSLPALRLIHMHGDAPTRAYRSETASVSADGLYLEQKISTVLGQEMGLDHFDHGDEETDEEFTPSTRALGGPKVISAPCSGPAAERRRGIRSNRSGNQLHRKRPCDCDQSR